MTGAHNARFGIRAAQVLLVAAGGALWGASRLPWVIIRSSDGLGPPRQAVVSGAAWSTALVPLALLALAAAVATVAVHGWSLRVLAVLLAAASLAAGYLGIGMWMQAAVTTRAAEIADVPATALVGGEPHHAGATLTLAAALCMLFGAALLMRAAAVNRTDSDRYLATAARRSKQRRDSHGSPAELSERMIWDALDDGRDPTDPDSGPIGEGR